MTKKHNTDLVTGDIATTIKRMAMPMIIGMIMMMSFGLVDTFFVSLLGTEPLAAISFTFPVTFTVISLTIGLGIGTSAVIAKLRGQNNVEQAKDSAAVALVLSVGLVGGLAIVGFTTVDFVFGILGAQAQLMPYIHEYMVIWYVSVIFMSVPMVGNSVLRAMGDTKTPSIIMASGGAINAVLDPILIFGLGPIPAMGITGAALATLIAWSCAAAYVIYYLAIKRELIHPRLPTMAEFMANTRSILKIGLPAAGSNMLTPVAGGILTAVVATYGAEAVAAWGVGNRLESISSILVLALSMSFPPFISQNLGAGAIGRVKQAYQMTIRFVVGWQLFVFVVMFLLSNVIASVFAEEQQVAELIALFLVIVPLGYGFQGVVILTNSSLNAIHMPMTALVLSIIRLFVFFVPVTVLGSYLFGLKGLYWGAVVANIAMAVVSYWWFMRTVNRLEMQSK